MPPIYFNQLTQNIYINYICSENGNNQQLKHIITKGIIILNCLQIHSISLQMIYHEFDNYRKAPHPFQQYGKQPPTSLINRYQPQNYSSIPQGDKHINRIGKKHYEESNKSKVVHDDAFNSSLLSKQVQKNPQIYYSRNKNYQRNLDTIDIQGAYGDSLKSSAVKYQMKAQEGRSKQLNSRNQNAYYGKIQSELKEYESNIQKGLKNYQKDKQLGKFISYKGNGYLSNLPVRSEEDILRIRESQQRYKKPINPSLLSRNVNDMFAYQKTAQMRNKYKENPQLTEIQEKNINSHKYNPSLNSNNLSDIFSTFQPSSNISSQYGLKEQQGQKEYKGQRSRYWERQQKQLKGIRASNKDIHPQEQQYDSLMNYNNSRNLNKDSQKEIFFKKQYNESLDDYLKNYQNLHKKLRIANPETNNKKSNRFWKEANNLSERQQNSELYNSPKMNKQAKANQNMNKYQFSGYNNSQSKQQQHNQLHEQKSREWQLQKRIKIQRQHPVVQHHQHKYGNHEQFQRRPRKRNLQASDELSKFLK